MQKRTLWFLVFKMEGETAIDAHHHSFNITRRTAIPTRDVNKAVSSLSTIKMTPKYLKTTLGKGIASNCFTIFFFFFFLQARSSFMKTQFILVVFCTIPHALVYLHAEEHEHIYCYTEIYLYESKKGIGMSKSNICCIWETCFPLLPL